MRYLPNALLSENCSRFTTNVSGRKAIFCGNNEQEAFNAAAGIPICCQTLPIVARNVSRDETIMLELTALVCAFMSQLRGEEGAKYITVLSIKSSSSYP